MDISSYNNYFFIGIAGTGMSAIAQYLNGQGKKVSGSDRIFNENQKPLIQEQFETLGIDCFFQDATGISANLDIVVISTAIEDSNIELIKARELGIPIVKRSELLAAISKEKRTIAVGGTSGKSTTSAMIFHIMQDAGYKPSIITGAGLTELQQQGLPGNAWIGESDWLVIEADESDGSIVSYIPEIGVLLNIDRDHKEYEELTTLFNTFKSNTRSTFIVNQDDKIAKNLSQSPQFDFSVHDAAAAKFTGKEFIQSGFSISFQCLGTSFSIPVIGKHNMENALASIAVCNTIGISMHACAKALKSYAGIYRRTQLVGISTNNVIVIDDFAHNPAEVVCAIKSCQAIANRVFAWFQPHGFGPLKFMHLELEENVINALRPNDTFLLSDVYYAGGTINKEITADDVFTAMKKKSNNVLLFKNRDELIPFLAENCQHSDVILLMGARDNSLSDFATTVLEGLNRVK